MNDRPDFSQQAKNFFVSHNCGVLSTISRSQNGFPFGSLTPYDVSPQGEPIIYISLIAEHYKNLAADKRGSICVTDPFAYRNPQAGARVTVLVEFEPIKKDEIEAVQAAYEARFPDSVNHEIAHNFLFMRGTPVKVRWIGGFGDITWIDGKKFIDKGPDPLAYSALDIIQHMNDDHQDALIELAKWKGIKDQKALTLSSVKSTGITITSLIDSQVRLEVPFAELATNSDAARTQIISLLKQARS